PVQAGGPVRWRVLQNGRHLPDEGDVPVEKVTVWRLIGGRQLPGEPRKLRGVELPPPGQVLVGARLGERAFHAPDRGEGRAQLLADLPQEVRRRLLVSLVAEKLDVIVELRLRPRWAEGARRTAVETNLVLAGDVQLDTLPRPAARELDGNHAMAHGSPSVPT